MLGGQLTLYQDGDGNTVTVIGNHYPDISPSNSNRRSNDNARDDVARDIGPDGQVNIDLMINPDSGRYFHRVEIQRWDTRWFHWIDADNGKVLNKYNGIATACGDSPPTAPAGSGCGVKGDTKSMAGITSLHEAAAHGGSNPHYDLSDDNYAGGGRVQTYDKRNRNGPWLYYITDSDDQWDIAGTAFPGHPAAVDAQYYMNITDGYFTDNLGFNWNSCYANGMQAVVHYGREYDNAFWSGTRLYFGDGSGIVFQELSGGLDVVAHEADHGMTDCTSDLIYQNQSGALNESFSDVLGSAAEHYAYANRLDLSVTPDYYVGEDVYIPTDDDPGFRNMANPREDEDPDHFGELYTGTIDNGGVHCNSGIPNHAYFLLVNGGKNAGCSDSTHRTTGIDHLHTTNCDISVNGIDISEAEAIFYLAFITLPATATMADARDATEIVAGALLGMGLVSAGAVDSTTETWCAVGVGDCGAPPVATAPDAPSGLSATGMSSSQINLTWTDNSSNENMFSVERSDDDGATFSQIATVGANVEDYSDTGLAPLATYYYRVMASNEVGDSDASNTDSAATSPTDTTAPGQVTGLVATTVGSSQLDLGWDANPETDMDHYNVYRSTNSGFTPDVGNRIAQPTGNSYSDTGLTADTPYYYQVSAVDTSANEGTPSVEASGTTAAPPPPGSADVSQIDIRVERKGPNHQAIVEVYAPQGTLINADFSHTNGAAGSDSDTVGGRGSVKLQSEKIRGDVAGGEFTIVITNASTGSMVTTCTATVGGPMVTCP